MKVLYANLKALRSAQKWGHSSFLGRCVRAFARMWEMRNVPISVLVLAWVALLPVPSASAAEITYTSLTGSWHDPVDTMPGSQPGDPVITNGVPTSIIRWGDDTPQS